MQSSSTILTSEIVHNSTNLIMEHVVDEAVSPHEPLVRITLLKDGEQVFPPQSYFCDPLQIC